MNCIKFGPGIIAKKLKSVTCSILFFITKLSSIYKKKKGKKITHESKPTIILIPFYFFKPFHFIFFYLSLVRILEISNQLFFCTIIFGFDFQFF